LTAPFTYEMKPVNTQLGSGSVSVKVESSKFNQASLVLEVDVEIEVEDKDGLKLNGKVEGKYKSGSSIDLYSTLKVIPPFEYKRDKIKATLASGSLGVKVESSKFEKVSFQVVDLEFEINITESDALKVKGSIDGKYDSGRTDLESTLIVRSPFVYIMEPVKARLVSGYVGVEVHSNEFEKASLQNIEVEVDIKIEDSDGLKLEGNMKGKYENELLDVDCEIGLRTPFNYTKNRLTANLISGSLSVKVESNTFSFAKITGIAINTDIEVGDKDLKLEGSINKGKYDNSDEIDLEASIELMGVFELVDISKFKNLTFIKPAYGSFDIKVEQSELIGGDLSCIEFSADISPKKDGVLKVNGSVVGKYERDQTTPNDTSEGSFSVDSFFDVFVGIDLEEFSGEDIGFRTDSFFDVFTEVTSIGSTIPVVGFHVDSDFDVFTHVDSNEPGGAVTRRDYNFTVGLDDFAGNSGSGINPFLAFDLYCSINVSAHFSRDDVKYKMNSFIKGEINIEMDQELDPVLGGTIEIEIVSMSLTGKFETEIVSMSLSGTLQTKIVSASLKTVIVSSGINIDDSGDVMGVEPSQFHVTSFFDVQSIGIFSPGGWGFTADSFFDVFVEIDTEGGGDGSGGSDPTDTILISKTFGFEINGAELSVTEGLPGELSFELSDTTMGQRVDNHKWFTIVQVNYGEWEVKKHLIKGDVALKTLFDNFAKGTSRTDLDDSGNVMGVEPSPFRMGAELDLSLQGIFSPGGWGLNTEVEVDTSTYVMGLDENPFSVGSLFEVFTEDDLTLSKLKHETQIGMNISKSGIDRKLSITPSSFTHFERSTFTVMSSVAAEGCCEDDTDSDTDDSDDSRRSAEINKSKFNRLVLNESLLVMFNPEKVTIKKQVEWEDQRKDWAKIENYSKVDRNEKETSGGNIDDSGDIMGVEPSPFRYNSFFDVFVEVEDTQADDEEQMLFSVSTLSDVVMSSPAVDVTDLFHSGTNFNIDSFFDISFEINNSDDDDRERECPECGVTVGTDDETCPECGAELGDDTNRVKISGYSKFHKLTRGKATKTWGNASGNVMGVEPSPFRVDSFFDVFTEVSMAIGIESVATGPISQPPEKTLGFSHYMTYDSFGQIATESIIDIETGDKGRTNDASSVRTSIGSGAVSGYELSPFRVDSFFDITTSISTKVTQPDPTTGGSEPEEPEDATRRVTSSIRTRSRVVNSNYSVDSFFDVHTSGIFSLGGSDYLFPSLFEWSWGTEYRFGDDSNDSSEEQGNRKSNHSMAMHSIQNFRAIAAPDCGGGDFQVDSFFDIFYKSPNPQGTIELAIKFEVKGLISSYSQINNSDADSDVTSTTTRVKTDYYNNGSTFSIDSFFDITYRMGNWSVDSFFDVTFGINFWPRDQDIDSENSGRLFASLSVESSSGGEGFIDELNFTVKAINESYNVKVKFPWIRDSDNDDDDFKTGWSRISVFMAGSSNGTYFLPEVDDEVLVAFLRGIPRAPYVIGVLWNGKDKTPVDASIIIDVNSSDDSEKTSRYSLERDNNNVIFTKIRETDVVFDNGDLWSLTLFDFEAGKEPSYEINIDYDTDGESQFVAETDYKVEIFENNTLKKTTLTFAISIYEMFIDSQTGLTIKKLVDTAEIQFVSIKSFIPLIPVLPIPAFNGIQIVNIQFESSGQDYLFIKGDIK